mmetsp:Transcript_25291/g.69715  ORF Transcript_25291/g.69715 Transcript_25291/m.69715 type:complete len:149 (-) Transcript_25291:3246-3692(-)
MLSSIASTSLCFISFILSTILDWRFPFQCFDLNSFLDIYKTAGGQRWKCGYCENFISHEDLEYCTLTDKMVKQFGDEMSNLQHTVEFKEDRSMMLCKPVRTSKERTKMKKERAAAAATAKGNPDGASSAAGNWGGADEVVEILDSDSE